MASVHGLEMDCISIWKMFLIIGPVCYIQLRVFSVDNACMVQYCTCVMGVIAM